jgi:hypothetical protein
MYRCFESNGVCLIIKLLDGGKFVIMIYRRRIQQITGLPAEFNMDVWNSLIQKLTCRETLWLPH